MEIWMDEDKKKSVCIKGLEAYRDQANQGDLYSYHIS